MFLKAGMLLGTLVLLVAFTAGCDPELPCLGLREAPQFELELGEPALGDLTGGRQPNILLVITDQEQAERFLPPTLHRPNLDRLRDTGIHFSNTFCSSPLCSPSRSSIFTGTFPHQNGMLGNMIFRSRGHSLDPDLPHLGSVLKSAGYRIGYKGKWDLSRGFGYFNLDFHDRGCASDYGFEGHCGTKRADQEVGVYGDFEAVREATRWIGEQDEEQPWFLVVSIVNPHDVQHLDLNPTPSAIRPDAQLPESIHDDLSGKPSDQLRNGALALFREGMTETGWLKYISYYYNLIESTDEHLERLYRALDNMGFLDDTIIIYTSDHGDMAGAHGFPFKGWGYEEDLRVPLYVSHPALEPGTSDSLISNVDLAPTIARLAGVLEWPADIPGRDFTGILRGETSSCRDSISAEFFAGEYIPGVIDVPKWCLRILRTQDWKLTFSLDLNDGQLYDLVQDPIEMNNLYHDPAYLEIRTELFDRMAQWRWDTQDILPCP